MLVAALSVSEIAQGRRSRRARGKCRKAHTFGSGMVGLAEVSSVRLRVRTGKEVAAGEGLGRGIQSHKME